MNDAHDTRHITTEIATATFYYAEDDHQQYLYKTRTAIAASAALASACRLRRNSDFRLNSEAVNERSGGFTFPYAILASVTAGPAPSDRFLCIPHLSYQLPFRGSGLNGQKRYVKQYFSNTLSDSRQCVFSISEISLAASRKIKLKLLADEGNVNAQRVLKMQENPGTFFTVVQIGLNAVAILGGICGRRGFLTGVS